VLVAGQLAGLRDGAADHRRIVLDAAADHRRIVLDAALLALSGRITLDPITDTTPERIVTELWEELVLRAARAATGPRAVDVPSAVRLPAPGPAGGLAPLARKPKVLDEAPALYRQGGVRGQALTGRHDGPAAGAAPPQGARGTAATAEQGTRAQLEELLAGREPDPEVARLAVRIARNLAVRRAPPDRASGRGRGRLASVPYRYGSDDIDLDRTIEVLAERPVPEDTDVIVRERVRTRRAIALIGDVSGSMRGEKTRIAVATIAALVGDLADDELAVVAFWSDAALLQPLGAAADAERLLTDLFRIPARGLTNVASRWRPGPPSWGAPARASGWGCCCRTASTTPGPTRARSRGATSGGTSCSRPTASTTRSWGRTSPASGTGSSSR